MRYATFGMVTLVALLVPLVACTSDHDALADSSEPKQSSSFKVPGTVHVLALPADGSDAVISGVSPSGAIVGNSVSGDPDKNVPIYWSSATATPVHLATTDAVYLRTVGITSSGIIGGAGTDGPFFWASNDAAVTPIPPLDESTTVEAVSMSDSGVLIGTATSVVTDPQTHKPGDRTSRCVTWRLPSTTPTLLALPTGASQLHDCRITSSGVLTATSTIGDKKVITIWSSPESKPVLLDTPRMDDPYAMITNSGPKGSFIGGGGSALSDRTESVGIYWSSAKASPVHLIKPNVGTDAFTGVVSDTGVIYGEAYTRHLTSLGGFAWASATAKPRPLTPPTGFKTVTVKGRNTSGDLFGSGQRGKVEPVPLIWTTN